MKKDWIPFEVALELKQLGFDEPCSRFYLMYLPAPTYSQAFRWFREEWAIHSWIRPNLVIDIPITYQFLINDDIDEDWYHTYEEAELACLKKLIEIAKALNI